MNVSAPVVYALDRADLAAMTESANRAIAELARAANLAHDGRYIIALECADLAVSHFNNTYEHIANIVIGMEAQRR